MNISRRSAVGLGTVGLGAASLLAAMVTGSGQSNAQTGSTTDSRTQTMSDRDAIIDSVNGIAIFSDLRDWQRCRQSFTDQVEFDYTSLLGGQPTQISADQQMQQWSTFFDSTFKSTQHLVGSHVVNAAGDTATCVANFQAHHTYLDSAKGTWILSGAYHYDLVRAGASWQVNKMRMTIAWETGNRPV